VKKKKPKLRMKSEASVEYAEVIDRWMRDWSPRRAKRASAGFSGSYGEIMLPMEVPMPTRKIIKPLERNELENVFLNWAFCTTIVIFSWLHCEALQKLRQPILFVACWLYHGVLR
jgi:hypothetical protein